MLYPLTKQPNDVTVAIKSWVDCDFKKKCNEKYFKPKKFKEVVFLILNRELITFLLVNTLERGAQPRAFRVKLLRYLRSGVFHFFSANGKGKKTPDRRLVLTLNAMDIFCILTIS